MLSASQTVKVLHGTFGDNDIKGDAENLLSSQTHVTLTYRLKSHAKMKRRSHPQQFSVLWLMPYHPFLHARLTLDGDGSLFIPKDSSWIGWLGPERGVTECLVKINLLWLNVFLTQGPCLGHQLLWVGNCVLLWLFSHTNICVGQALCVVAWYRSICHGIWDNWLSVN